jgi:hypothetical protein
MGSSARKRNDKKIRRKHRVEKRNNALQKKHEKEDNKIKIKIGPYDKGLVSEQFVTEVINCLHNIRLNDRSIFTEKQERIFKWMKKIGFSAVLDELETNCADDPECHRFAVIPKIGETVYEQLKNKNVLLNYIPYTHATIKPVDNEFLVIFRALQKQKSKFGTLYHSSLKPTVRIDDREYIVAFSRHAIERICERAIMNWQTFLGANDAFLYLERCVKYDIVEDANSKEKKYFITFYEPCAIASGNMIYINRVLEKIENNTDYCFRIGYCPIEINGDYACALTLLTPGMKGTPEDLLLKESDLSYEDKQKIRADVQDMISKKIWFEKRNFEAIKWFHQNGISQVMKVEEKIFENFYDQYQRQIGYY